MWKQEVRNPGLTDPKNVHESFGESWKRLMAAGRVKRLLLAAGFGTAGFSMQDILLEPFGGQVFGLSVGQTTLLTAILAIGSLTGFALAARMLGRGADPHRIGALGILIGISAFAAIIFSPMLGSVDLFRAGTVGIGMGGGLFSVGMLTAAMELADKNLSGLALGAWGGVQATASGLAIALGGSLRDAVSTLAERGDLGPALEGTAVGYSFVYHLEIGLLFVTLIVVGPLVRVGSARRKQAAGRFGLAEYPG
jgi:BCD family chlorophyll transporter-like MFS transporter